MPCKGPVGARASVALRASWPPRLPALFPALLGPSPRPNPAFSLEQWGGPTSLRREGIILSFLKSSYHKILKQDGKASKRLG